MALSKEQILTLSCLKDVGVKGIGPKRILSIGSKIDGVQPDVVLASTMAEMQDKTIKAVTPDDLEAAARKADSLIEESESQGIHLLGYYDETFPQKLRDAIDEEGKPAPPILIWYKGDLSILNEPGLAIIGTREPTQEGVAGGLYLAKEFAKRGLNIISGLAVGCDTCGHRGALDVGGKTTAILANGLDSESIYPPENKALAEEIVNAGGLLLSESCIGTRANRYNLVARDRLQAGLALATLVIQTGATGGTWHAANTTLVAKKPLYVVKYKNAVTNNHMKCEGNRMMVAKGAKAISASDNIDDVVAEIKGPSSTPTKKTETKMRKIIFDLDLTLIDTTVCEEARHQRKWQLVYSLIPQCKMYDGIAEVLDVIRKHSIPCCIVSTAPRPYVEKLVSHFNIPAQHIVGYHDAKPIKPHPAQMLKALELLGCNASEAISFGDRVIDIQASNAANIESVACFWGTKEKSELIRSGYNHAILKPSEIITLIR